MAPFMPFTWEVKSWVGAGNTDPGRIKYSVNGDDSTSIWGKRRSVVWGRGVKGFS